MDWNKQNQNQKLVKAKSVRFVYHLSIFLWIFAAVLFFSSVAFLSVSVSIELALQLRAFDIFITWWSKPLDSRIVIENSSSWRRSGWLRRWATWPWTIELIRKRGIGTKKEIQLNAELGKKIGGVRGGGVAVADGNTNVGERRSAVNRRRVACEDARIDKERWLFTTSCSPLKFIL